MKPSSQLRADAILKIKELRPETTIKGIVSTDQGAVFWVVSEDKARSARAKIALLEEMFNIRDDEL